MHHHPGARRNFRDLDLSPDGCPLTPSPPKKALMVHAWRHGKWKLRKLRKAPKQGAKPDHSTDDMHAVPNQTVHVTHPRSNLDAKRC